MPTGSGEREIMLAALIVAFQCVEDGLQVFLVAEEVRVRGVHEERLYIMLPDVLGIGLLYAEQVFLGDILFIGSFALADVLQQIMHGGVEVDEQVRLYHLLVNDLEQPLIEAELVLGQVHLGEQEAFREQVVRYRDVLEKVFLGKQVLQLLVPLSHEEELQRKRELLGILVEPGQEGIVSKGLQDQPGIVVFGEQVC
jgi:hypothetical protein